MNRLSCLALVTVVLLSACFASNALAQAASPVITKSFSPAVVVLNGNSIGTITVTNPNAVPLTNVQFSDIMPAGIDLITQTGGTCSTLATGGGMFSINPGTETFSSTSNVLAAGQSCTITVSVNGITFGAHINTTSQVTCNEAPPGAAASGTLTVLAAPTIATTASASVTVGGAITDTATLAGGSSPTGTITFTLFGPNDATCASTPDFTSTVTVNGNGSYTSSSFTTVSAGTYNWMATYSGDANNGAATSPCADPNESVIVTAPTPVTLQSFDVD
jgi:uncharacterized repeat protein (TIGR01451 family)